MFDHLNQTATAVFVFFFALVTVMGFAAARWKAATSGTSSNGASAAGNSARGSPGFCSEAISTPPTPSSRFPRWFLHRRLRIFRGSLHHHHLSLSLSDDAALWAVSRKHGYVTAGDFVPGRYGRRGLELAVAFTGILATMPYIALQLVGLEKVILALGFSGPGSMAHAPLTIAFVILALYTYTSGFRAPAMIAFVKDAMIYIFILAAIVIFPTSSAASARSSRRRTRPSAKPAANPKPAAGLMLKPSQVSPYITLAIGSAMALFMYPHALTGALAASSGRAIRFNTMALPAYSFVLGLVALLGLMAIAAGVEVGTPQDAVPQLVLWAFPDWFAGFCFAAIALGALVPAAVMSIGAANTFTRNVWKPFVNPQMSPREESTLAKLASLAVKVGALAVIFFMPTQFALDLQLLGGVWMVQIFPAMILGLYTRWFSGAGLLIGWAAGMIVGTALSWAGTAWVPVHALKWDLPFVGAVDPGLGFAAYNGLTAVILNLVLSAAFSLVLRPRTNDETAPEDYEERALA